MENLSELWMCNYVDNTKIDSDTHDNLVKIWNCDWNHFMQLPLASKLMHSASTDDEIDVLPNDAIDVLSIAISSLQLFVQQNFIGPNIDYFTVNDSSSSDLRSMLQINGINLDVNVEHPELLLLSFKLIKKLLLLSPSNYVLQWWYLRVLYIYAEVLDDRSESLFSDFGLYSEELLKQSEDLAVETRALLLLELAQQYLAYKRVDKSKEYLTMVRNVLNTEFEVKGVLGVRTKFQQKAVPQLSLKIEGNFESLESSNVTHRDTLLPKLLNHDDDTRLERVQFQSDDENTVAEVPSLIQLLVLATLKHVNQSQPQDHLAMEEVKPYLTTLLYQTNGPWSSRIATLMMNIQMEAYHKRTVERSFRQCEEISNLTNSANVPSIQRLSFVYASFARPRWFVSFILGKLMMSIGLVKSALDCYVKIQNWDEAIMCYTWLGMRQKAIETINQELEKKPSVELYCMMGDIAEDPTFYDKAWKLSNEKSGRAQRHWGAYYFKKRQYAEAIPHLQKSVEANSLQQRVWSELGYSALRVADYELGAKAYRMCANLEPNSFEAWTNLSNAYIHLGDKARAHKVLHEAIKCNFDNWKVWENFLYSSIDTNNWEDVLNAYSRLIELKGKYYDDQLLCHTIKSITNLDDANKIPPQLRKKAKTLLGHLCAQLPSEGLLWELSAMLCRNEPLAQAQKLQKAYRCYTQIQTMSWTAQPQSCLKVLEVSHDLCQASLEGFADQKTNEKSLVLSQLSSARLIAQGSVRAANDSEWADQCEAMIEKINKLLGQIKDVLLKNL